jgi:DeoR family deoxyribose operon repressor
MAGRKSERLDLLAEAISERGVLHLKDAARLLNVSEMTVRRDIGTENSRFGFFGGHIMLAGGEGPYELTRATDSHAHDKRAACEHALRLIRPEETIFLDCGSTMIHLAEYLPQGMPLTVVCYALNIAERLSHNAAIRLILLGGLYHPASASFSGQQALDMLDQIGINIAFLSAAGIDETRGATCAHFHEAQIKQKAIMLAQKSVLVADSSKFGKVRPAFFAPLDAFASILTETGEWRRQEPDLPPFPKKADQAGSGD